VEQIVGRPVSEQPRITKLLIANRGEIAVRIIRAARDAGIATLAVYAEADREGLFVQLADEAFSLQGATPADSYLNIPKLLDVAARAGANAVHPGYGFLAESAEFAQAVLDAGLIWIGPPPAAIEALGDKVRARHLAHKVGAPLVPGTADPVANADEVINFAEEHGLPIAIKAAFGGGGRGLKIARTMSEIPDQFASATREAEVAFGRGECFVERYLDRPRHVETQCLADAHGTVVVVSTRDCSLQRRHQKLIEEAPAPFLSADQIAELHRASRAILAEAGYQGAGTVEFLVAVDGTISFLEVNTRLQVEHPVSEEVTGIDLVREMFRIAEGEELGYDSVSVRGHSIEFRINAEDPGRNFLPTPGFLLNWQPPTGPGVRVDEGYHSGMQVPGTFDSLVAKVIVTGADRDQALARSRRALAELRCEGMPTVVGFHRAVVDDPAFTAADGEFRVHTRWIETDFSTHIAPHTGVLGEAPDDDGRRTVLVEVNGRRVEVSLPSEYAPGPSRATPKRHRRDRGGAVASEPSGDKLTCPMQGTVVSVRVVDGDQVAAGEVVCVVEAMKMEQPITAHRSGVVSQLTIQPGKTVTAGQVLCSIAGAD